METCVTMINRVEGSVTQSAHTDFKIVKMSVDNYTEHTQTSCLPISIPVY